MSPEGPTGDRSKEKAPAGSKAGDAPSAGEHVTSRGRWPEWARRPGPMVVMGLAYVVAMSAIMGARRVPLTPDYLLLLLVPVLLLSARFSRVAGDWMPFASMVLAYEAMRALVQGDGIAPQVTALADAEIWIFAGHDPNQVLQQAVSGSALHLLAVAATVVYFCHFAVPPVVGLALWITDRTQYLRFVTALFGMCMAAFALFVLVPTAPPWYAAQHGALRGVTDLIVSQHTLPGFLSHYYSSLDPNPTAAFPSLHAAFPILGWLALRRVYPRGSWILFGWALLVFLSVVFLGEHYVIDVAAGVALAAAAWSVMMRLVVPRVAVLRAGRDGRPHAEDTHA